MITVLVILKFSPVIQLIVTIMLLTLVLLLAISSFLSLFTLILTLLPFFLFLFLFEECDLVFRHSISIELFSELVNGGDHGFKAEKHGSLYVVHLLLR